MPLGGNPATFVGLEANSGHAFLRRHVPGYLSEQICSKLPSIGRPVTHSLGAQWSQGGDAASADRALLEQTTLRALGPTKTP